MDRLRLFHNRCTEQFTQGLGEFGTRWGRRLGFSPSGPQVWIEMSAGMLRLGTRRATVGPGHDPARRPPPRERCTVFHPKTPSAGLTPAPAGPPTRGEPSRASLDAHWGPGRLQCAGSGPQIKAELASAAPSRWRSEKRKRSGGEAAGETQSPSAPPICHRVSR